MPAWSEGESAVETVRTMVSQAESIYYRLGACCLKYAG